jgi:hypothetical protein
MRSGNLEAEVFWPVHILRICKPKDMKSQLSVTYRL